MASKPHRLQGLTDEQLRQIRQADRHWKASHLTDTTPPDEPDWVAAQRVDWDAPDARRPGRAG